MADIFNFEPFTKRQRDILAARDYLGEEVWKEWNLDYESLLAYKKTIKGKPDIYQKLQLEINKSWINYYKYILFHNNGVSDCTCRRCDEKRKERAKLNSAHSYINRCYKQLWEEQNNGRTFT